MEHIRSLNPELSTWTLGFSGQGLSHTEAQRALSARIASLGRDQEQGLDKDIQR